MDDIVNPLLLKVKKASPMYILGQDANIVEDYELRVPGGSRHQQADQRRGCSQTREEAYILHCVQQSDGAFVYLNSASCSVLC